MNKLTLVLLFCLCGSLQAQTVWRCSVDGRTVYTDAPCPEGQSLASSDSRTPEQLAEARRVAQADQQRARKMVQERQARELENGSGLIAIGSSDRDLFKRSTTLSKKTQKKSAKRASKHPEEASTSPSAARATRQTRG